MPTTPPEQTNDRPDSRGNGGPAADEINPDQTEPGRGTIRPVPGDERDGQDLERGSGGDGISGPGDGEILPDPTEPGRGTIRPVPDDERS